MRLFNTILLLLLLLVIFIAGCVYTKIEQFTNEFAPITLQSEIIENIEVVEDEEPIPLPKVEFEKTEILTPLTVENSSQIEKTTEQINEQDFEKKEEENIQIPVNLNLQERINKVTEKSTIMFQRMSYDVTIKSNEIIEKIAQILIENPNIKIEVAGHTDSKGDDSFNQKISEQRAESVKELLINFGVNENRLSAKGYGETKPFAPNDKDGYSLINRRVEFNIIGE